MIYNPHKNFSSSIKNDYSLWFFISITFLIYPLICITFLSVYILLIRRSNDQFEILLCIFLALYLGLINSTRIPISDLLAQKKYFTLAGELNFWDYIKTAGKEFVFYGVTYISYYLFFGNFKFYVILFTFIGYYLGFISIYKFWKRQKSSSSTFLFSALLLTFYFVIFDYSAHLIRQTLSGFIFVYFLIEKVNTGKSKWILVILAVFTHTSSVILFLISFIPRISQKLNFKNASIIIVSIFLILLIGSPVLNLLNSMTSNFEIINYGFTRLNDSQSLENSDYSKSAETYARFEYFGLLIVISIYYKFAKARFPVHYLFNFIFLFALVEEFWLYLGYNFLQFRFSVYMHLFVPFIVPFLFLPKSFNELNQFMRLMKTCIIMVLVYLFFKKLSAVSGIYAPINELIFFPVPLYF